MLKHHRGGLGCPFACPFAYMVFHRGQKAGKLYVRCGHMAVAKNYKPRYCSRASCPLRKEAEELEKMHSPAQGINTHTPIKHRDAPCA